MAGDWREQQREATGEEIRRIAWAHMAEGGAETLSLRAIAREMGMTAPALYRYFGSKDELVTALVLDGFHGMADAIEAGAGAQGNDPLRRLVGGLLAFRRWAVENPAAFSLVYGTPIPGYEAPAEETVPAAARSMVLLVEALGAAGPPRLPEVPPALRKQIEERMAAYGYAVPVGLFYAAISLWAHLHGLISLELYGHLEPVSGGAGAFYRQEVAARLAALGLDVESTLQEMES